MHAQKRKLTLKGVLTMIPMLLLAFIQLFPLIWLVDFSLCKSNQLFTSGILVWPEELQWGNYAKALVGSNFLHYLGNSIVINVLAVILVVLISVMAAFACGRMHWKLSGLVSMLLMMGLMIPIHATLLPNYMIFDRVGILDSLFALLIPLCGVLAAAGLLPDLQLYGLRSEGAGGGGDHGRLRHLSDTRGHHPADDEVVADDGRHHDLSQQLE